jgi:transcriptional regulator with XRE-family HTH domain
MPARLFDAQALLLARRALGAKQSDVAKEVGVSAARVSAWEKARSVPDPEKLPRLAAAVRKDLDELFPRKGRPDLADLRADAGYSQSATRELTGTRTPGPVAAAENGQRRLSREYEQRLADAYGVSVDVLRRAQERSFGHDVPEPDESPCAEAASAEAAVLPATLAGKITYQLGRLPAPMTDAALAARGNGLVGAEVLTADLVRGLRTGAVVSATDEVLRALAEALDTTPLMFKPGDAGVERVIAETLVLSNQVAAIAARGGAEAGLSAELLAFIHKEVAKARTEAIAPHDHRD